MREWSASHVAIFIAFSQCPRVRHGSERIPRRINQQSKGDGTPPQVVWISRTRSEKSVLVFAIRTPPVTSECPPRYFVVECMTKSAPRSSGRWTIGAQVLSHAQ